MISYPQTSSNNLLSALSLWNRFKTPTANPPGPDPLPNPGPDAPAQDFGTVESGLPYAPPADAQSWNIVPKAQSWDGAEPWFGSATANKNGTIKPDTSSSDNLSKAAGAAGGLGALFGSI